MSGAPFVPLTEAQTDAFVALFGWLLLTLIVAMVCLGFMTLQFVRVRRQGRI